MPAVQRAGRRFRPRVARHPGRAGRRRLGAHRPEGVDDLGAPGRLRRLPGPDRPGGAQAAGHHLLPGGARRPGGGGAAAAPHRRRGRLQRGVPRPRAGARRPPGRGGRHRVGGGERHPVGRAPDGGGVGLGRRRPHRRRRGPPAAGPGGRRSGGPPAGGAALRGGADPRVDQPAGAGRPRGGPHARAGELDRQGPPGRAQPADPGPGGRPARRGRPRLGVPARDLRGVAALRAGGHAPQPGQHDRGRHHRGQQDHRRRAGARPSPRARPVERRAVAGGARGVDASYATLRVERAGRSAGSPSTGPRSATPWTPPCSPSWSGRGPSSTATTPFG